MVAASYRVFADFDGDGDFDQPSEEITARVLDERSPVTMSYGRDQARALSPTKVGDGSYELNNASRDYSPENTASPLYGKVRPGIRTLIRSDALTLAADTFTRTASSSWGTTTSGHPWTVSGGAAGDYSVTGAVGRQSLGSVNVPREAKLGSVAVSDFNVALGPITISAAITGGALEIGLRARYVDASNFVEARVFFAPGSVEQVHVRQVVAGAEAFTAFVPLTGIADTGPVMLRFTGDGSTLRARAWTGTEPATWNLTFTTTHVAVGPIAVRSLLGTGNTNTLPLVVSVDNFSATLDERNLLAAVWEDVEIKPAIEDWSADVTCLDALGQLRDVKVTTPVYQGLRTGEAVHKILDAVGWPDALRRIDPGVSVLPFWWLDEEDAYTALTELVDSEGPPAMLTADAAFGIVFRDRGHRIWNPASAVAQSTWRSDGALEPTFSAPTSYQFGWKEIINAVTFPVARRQVDALSSVVWESGEDVTIDNGDTVEITARGTEAFMQAVELYEGIDYVVRYGTVTASLTRYSGGSTGIRLTAVGGDAKVTGLQLRAHPLRVVSNVDLTTADSASIGKYGRREYPGGREPKWASGYDIIAITQLIVGRRAEPVSTITVTMRGGSAARLAQQLSRDLSDRVRVIESHTGLDSDCHVEQIAHTLTQGGAEHTTTFGLEKIPLPAAPVARFDTAGAGFDQGRFAPLGYNDPAVTGRFDSADPAQGFDSAVFAY